MYSVKVIFCFFALWTTTLAQFDEGRFVDADQITTDLSLNFNSNSQQYDLRHTIPGEPEVDYPIYSKAPRTSFSCDKHREGYYADTETRCQVFRICTNTDTSGEGFAFLCPNGTLFSQRNFVCDWYRNVDCAESESFYYKNAERGIGTKDEIMNQVKQMVEHPIKTISKVFERPTVSKAFLNFNSFNQKPKSDFNLNIPKPKPQPQQQPTRKAFITQTTTKRIPFEFKNTQKPNFPTFTKTENNFNSTFGSNKTPTIEITTLPPLKQITKTTTVSGKTSRFNQILPKGEVYVSSLGELSTDPGANFDPNNAKILAEPASKVNKNFAAKVNDGLSGSEDNNKANIIAPEYVRSIVQQQQKQPDLVLQPPLGAFPDLANNINGLIDELAFESKSSPQSVFPTSKSPRNLKINNKTEKPFKFLSRGFTRTQQPTQSIQQQLPQNSYPISQVTQQPGLTNVPLALGQYPGTDFYYYYVPTAIPITTNPTPIQQYARRPQSLSAEELSSTSQDINLHKPTTSYTEPVTDPMTTLIDEQIINTTTEPLITTTEKLQETIPDVIIDKNDTNALDDFDSEPTITVHKRAEKLLLDGVKLTLLNDIENSIENPKTTETILNALNYSYQPLIINVPDELEIKETTLTTPSTTSLNTTEENTTEKLSIPTPLSVQKFSKNILSRRQTVKPIVYTKKPISSRNNVKTTSTTRVPALPRSRSVINRYSIGTGQSSGDALRRLALKRSKETIIKNENFESDLTAVASTYGARTTNLNRIRLIDSYKYLNRTKSNTRNSFTKKPYTTTVPIHSTTTSPSLSISLPSTLHTTSFSTLSPLNTEPNQLSSKTFIPFDQLLRHAISDDSNLQTIRNPQVASTKQNQPPASTSSKRVSQQASQLLNIPQPQQVILSPYAQQYDFQNPSIIFQQPAPQSILAEITQPKVVIAKSEEQVPYTITSDLNQNLQRIPLTAGQSQYVPLDDFIAQTLSTQIKQQALANGKATTTRTQSSSKQLQKVNQNKQPHLVATAPVAQRRVGAAVSQQKQLNRPQQNIASPSRPQSNVSAQKPAAHHQPSVVSFQGQPQNKAQHQIHVQQHSAPHRPSAQTVHHRASQQQVITQKTQNVLHKSPTSHQQAKTQQPQQRPVNSKQSGQKPKQQKPVVQPHKTHQVTTKSQPSIQSGRQNSHQTNLPPINFQSVTQQTQQQNYAPQFYQQMTSHNYQPIDSTQQQPSHSTDITTAKSQPETPILLPNPSQFTGLTNIESNDINGLIPHTNTHSTFPQFTFNHIPIAQRRFDLTDKALNEEGSLFSGVTSYDVPLSSIGRLPNDITHLLRRYRRH